MAVEPLGNESAIAGSRVLSTKFTGPGSQRHHGKRHVQPGRHAVPPAQGHPGHKPKGHERRQAGNGSEPRDDGQQHRLAQHAGPVQRFLNRLRVGYSPPAAGCAVALLLSTSSRQNGRADQEECANSSRLQLSPAQSMTAPLLAGFTPPRWIRCHSDSLERWAERCNSRRKTTMCSSDSTDCHWCGVLDNSLARRACGGIHTISTPESSNACCQPGRAAMIWKYCLVRSAPWTSMRSSIQVAKRFGWSQPCHVK